VRTWGEGCGDLGLRFDDVLGLGFRVQDMKFRAQGSGLRM
jgi:hypothetical protein